MSGSRPPIRYFLTLCCAVNPVVAPLCVRLLALVPGLPNLYAFLRHGRTDMVGLPLTWHVWSRLLWPTNLRVGSTQFSEAHRYYKHDTPVISAESRAAYLQDGYLLLKALMPVETVEALREELLATLGTTTNCVASHNSWMFSGALLDFYSFGPLAAVASALINSSEVHLIFHYHVFRPAAAPPSIPDFHYDLRECEQNCTPAGDFEQSKVKFYIPLYDMPSMWFVNQTAFENLVLQEYGRDIVEAYRAGMMSRCIPLNGSDLEASSLKLGLGIGDAIVHSPCMMHRSAEENGGVSNFFIAPSFAASNARFTGRYLVDEKGHACESGIDPGAPFEHAPPVADAPLRDCFPQVYPPEIPRSRVGRPLAAFAQRRFAHQGPVQRYLDCQDVAWQQALAMPHTPQAKPPIAKELPGELNVVRFAAAERGGVG